MMAAKGWVLVATGTESVRAQNHVSSVFLETSSGGREGPPHPFPWGGSRTLGHSGNPPPPQQIFSGALMQRGGGVGGQHI